MINVYKVIPLEEEIKPHKFRFENKGKIQHFTNFPNIRAIAQQVKEHRRYNKCPLEQKEVGVKMLVYGLMERVKGVLQVLQCARWGDWSEIDWGNKTLQKNWYRDTLWTEKLRPIRADFSRFLVDYHQAIDMAKVIVEETEQWYYNMVTQNSNVNDYWKVYGTTGKDFDKLLKEAINDAEIRLSKWQKVKVKEEKDEKALIDNLDRSSNMRYWTKVLNGWRHVKKLMKRGNVSTETYKTFVENVQTDAREYEDEMDYELMWN